MDAPVLADTGPLVAFLDRNDPAHPWALAQFQGFSTPPLTCEAVLSECIHLTAHCDPGARRLVELLRADGLRLAFDLDDHFDAVARLMAKYADVPMSLADACLVRMSELQTSARIFTIDSDFKIYRRLGRQSIPLIFTSL